MIELLALYYFTILCIAVKVIYDMCEYQFPRILISVTLGVLAANQIYKMTLNWIFN